MLDWILVRDKTKLKLAVWMSGGRASQTGHREVPQGDPAWSFQGMARSPLRIEGVKNFKEGRICRVTVKTLDLTQSSTC